MDSVVGKLQHLSLGQMADALVGVESSRALLARVEDLLGTASALPARLYLFDGDAQVFYGAAGFGCEREAAEIPLDRVLGDRPPHWHPLRSQGSWIGLLEILSAGAYPVEAVDHHQPAPPRDGGHPTARGA
jgi:hypothetical protein